MNTLAPPSAPAALTSRDRSASPAVSFICHCLGITESSVRDCIALLSEPTLEAVMEMSGAGDGCSSCHRRIERLLTGQSPSACGSFSLCDRCGSCRAICSCSRPEDESLPLSLCGERY